MAIKTAFLLRTTINQLKNLFGHRLIEGATILVITQYIAVGIGLVTNIMAARMLGAVDYGLVALVLSYPTLLWSFTSFKPITITTRYLAQFRVNHQYEEIASICKIGYGLDVFAASLVFFIVLVTAQFVSQHVYNYPKIAWLIIVYAFFFPFSSLTGTSQAVLYTWERFHWLAGLQIASKLTTLLILTTLLFFKWGVLGVVIATALGQAFLGVLSTYLASKLLKESSVPVWWRASNQILVSFRQEFVSLFGWNYLIVTFYGALSQIPVIMLGRLVSIEAAGFYRLSNTLVNSSSYIETSLSKVIYPTLSSQWAQNKQAQIIGNLKKWSKYALFPAILLLLLIFVVLPLAVPLVFGESYNKMVLGAQIMMLETVIRIIFFWVETYYYVSGEVKTLAIYLSIYILFVIIAGRFGIRLNGFVGLASIIVFGRITYILLLASKALWRQSV